MLLYTAITKRRWQRPSGPATFNTQSPLAAGLSMWLPLSGDTRLYTPNSPLIAPVSTGVDRISTPIGIAANFDADTDQLNYGAPDADTSSGSTVFTLSCWATIQVIDITRRWVARSGTGSGNFRWAIYNGSDAKLSMFVSDGATRFTLCSTTASAIQADGHLHHYGFVFDSSLGTPVTFYIDGVAQPAAVVLNQSSTIGSATTSLTVGQDIGGTAGIIGSLSDIAIWSRKALSVSEVWRFYDPATRWDLYQTPPNRSTFVIQPKPVVGHAPAIRTSRGGGSRPNGPLRVNKNHSLARGLVEWFEPNAQTALTRDFGSAGFTHSLVGSPKQVGAAIGGLAVYGTGGNAVNIAASSFNGLTTAFTFRVVARPLSWPGAFTAFIDDITRGATIFCDTSGNISFSGAYCNFGGQALTAGQRWDLVFVHDKDVDPSFNYTYINGLFRGSSSACMDTSSPISLGANISLGGTDADCLYETVQVWNRGLTAAEVWQLYDPATRWSLYAKPPSTSYAFLGLETIKPARIAVR